MGPEAPRVFRFLALVCVLQTGQTHRVFVRSSSMLTKDGKVCSRFDEQFHIFHQGKGKSG